MLRLSKKADYALIALRHLAASMNIELMDGSPALPDTAGEADRWDGLKLVKPDGHERSARTVKG